MCESSRSRTKVTSTSMRTPHKDVLRGIAIIPNRTDEGSDVVVVRDEFEASDATRLVVDGGDT